MEKINNFWKNYKIIKTIGKGGSGVCVLVEKEDKKFVIKKINISELELSKEMIENYQELVLYLSRIITNDNVIKYYKSEIEGDYLNILMEYGGNSNLKQFIYEYKDRDTVIDEKIINDIIIQICNGLKDIHNAKIIHRDLTPDNIFINKNNNKVKIGDFSISKKLGFTNQYTKSQIGKQHYIAPELEKGLKNNTKVDIYAFGCIIYELFTLNEYYIDKRIDETDCRIDTDKYNPKWQELIDLLLKKDYHERPDIEEIYNMIKDY